MKSRSPNFVVKNARYLLAYAASFLLAAPHAFASSHWTIESIVEKIIEEIMNPLIMLLMVLATVIFLWGVVQMLANPDNEQKRSEGKKHMVWGIIGLTIMVSVWGIVGVLCEFFETCDIVGGGGDFGGGSENENGSNNGNGNGDKDGGGGGPPPGAPDFIPDISLP